MASSFFPIFKPPLLYSSPKLPVDFTAYKLSFPQNFLGEYTKHEDGRASTHDASDSKTAQPPGVREGDTWVSMSLRVIQAKNEHNIGFSYF